MKVTKFGGTSLATTSNILKAKQIVLSDPDRRFIVVSAPGKSTQNQSKVTDLLIEAHTQLCITGSSESLNKVISRFEALALELGVDITPEIDRCLDETQINNCSRDFIISRGEYLMGILFSKLVGFRFIDATRLITIRSNGKVDELATREKFIRMRKEGKFDGGVVIGGFYGQGSTDCGVKTFDRGGSDYSGAIASVMLHATAYENFTDTYGVQSANPAIVVGTETIWRLDYNTLHKLARNGASIIYPECLPLLKKYSVPLVIDNTMDSAKRFTTVSHENTGDSYFAITYQSMQNINKATAQILVTYQKIPFEIENLKTILQGLDAYLTGYKSKGKQSGEVTLLSATDQVNSIVNRLHSALIH